MKVRILVATAFLALVSIVPAAQLAAETKSIFTKQEYNTDFLTRLDLQKEFGLSDEVYAKIHALHMANLEAFEKIRSHASGEVTTEQAVINRDGFRKMMDDDVQQSMALLTPAQQKRLREITLQSQGAGAVLLPNVEKDLEISPAQHKLIEAEIQKLGSDTKGWRKAFSTREGPTMTQLRAGRLDDMKTLDRSIPKLLTKEQQKKWKALLGKRIALDKIIPPAKDMPRPKKG